MAASRSSSFSSSSSSSEEEGPGPGGPPSPVGLEGCGCCRALEAERRRRGAWARPRREPPQPPQPPQPPPPPGSPFPWSFPFRDPRFCRRNLNGAQLRRMLSGGWRLEALTRDPGFLRRHGLCNRNVDQTLLAILLFFHSASGSSVVAIDNKIEQAMDLVKNHLMYAVREEVEVLKEQIKELAEKNSQLERENSLLKTLASPEQLQRFQSCLPLEGPQSPLPAATEEKQGPSLPPAAPAQRRAAADSAV